MPMRKVISNRTSHAEISLAVANFLPTSHKTNDRRPIGVSI